MATVSRLLSRRLQPPSSVSPGVRVLGGSRGAGRGQNGPLSSLVGHLLTAAAPGPQRGQVTQGRLRGWRRQHIAKAMVTSRRELAGAQPGCPPSGTSRALQPGLTTARQLPSVMRRPPAAPHTPHPAHQAQPCLGRRAGTAWQCPRKPEGREAPGPGITPSRAAACLRTEPAAVPAAGRRPPPVPPAARVGGGERPLPLGSSRCGGSRREGFRSGWP